MASLTPQAEAAISKIPACASNAIQQGILSSPCGLDIACICLNDAFIEVLQSSISKTCDRNDQEATLAFAKILCVGAIPSLADSKQSELTVTISILIVLATLAVLLRFYCKRIIKGKLGPDDYTILVALVLTYGLNINSFFAIKSGTGLHLITLTLDQIESFLKTDEASQVIFTCAITAIKISILLFYRRLFPSRGFRNIALATGCVNILWCFGSILAAFLHCRPLAFYWDKSIPGGVCANDNTVGYSITATELVTDIIVLILPMPWLWRLKLATKQKLAVIVLFLLGTFVCIAGIIRIPLLAKLKISDATWTAIDAGIWINVECNIGIVSACLPLLRPLFATEFSTSPAFHLARLLRSFSNYTLKGSQQRDASRTEGKVSTGSGSNRTRVEKAYRTPANSYASESSPDIGPEPPPKDEKYLRRFSAAVSEYEDSLRSTFETIRPGDSERSTFETTREDEAVRDLEKNWNRSSCKLVHPVRSLSHGAY